ncbi:sodium:phosphate symporter [Cytophagales bacterium WSM2-2]|nr:sodium:phosphate symporter [Cytophagales bacterium WSM2-2]
MDVHPDLQTIPEESFNWKNFLRNTIYFLLALLVFLFSLELMISSILRLGSTFTDAILLATSNPFTGLFIGLLATAIIQSSSATTSITVALVASGSLSLQSAVPIIMGANIGTTITSTIVSLSFINRKKEFRRAVSAGTYHDFFNILTALILFPLEYNFQVLSSLAQYIATHFFNEPAAQSNISFKMLGLGLSWPVNFISEGIGNGYWLAALSLAMLFGSILFFRKVITNVFGFGSQTKFRKFFFKNPYKSFAWGLLTTAAIRSSTVTTSLVVPLVAKKVIKLRQAGAFILGANIGTTITAFLASTFNSNAAISIALTHFLFNFIGVLFFFRTPFLKEIPFKLCTNLGRLTLKNRLIGFLYLLLTFFLIPFSLIFLSQ